MSAAWNFPGSASSSNSSQSSGNNETKTRVKTGVLGGGVLLVLLLFGGHIGITLIAATIAAGMCWELSSVFLTLNDAKEKRTALLGIAWLIIFANMIFAKVILETVVFSFLGLFAYYLAIAERHGEELRKHFDEFIYTIFIMIYVIVFITFLPMIRDSFNGVRWVILFLCMVWAGDTGAYFVGRKYGKKKLYPLISPGKTVEGAVGGLIASVLIAVIAKFTFFTSLGWFGMLCTPIVIGVVSQIGDLCESFFKRSYKLKDSGNILPGHGGFLDRFDGVLFSLPVMYFCVKLFG